MTVTERIAQLAAEGSALERQLVAGQQKLIHIQGQLAALEAVSDGAYSLAEPEEATP